MKNDVSPIILRNGMVFDDPLSLARHFIRKDGSYAAYDEPYVAHNNNFLMTDLMVARKLKSRTGCAVEEAIMHRTPELEKALAKILPESSLLSNSDEIPWHALEELFEIMLSISRVGISVATKVLHKKRPGLIPILDSVLQSYLRAVDSIPDLTNAKLAIEFVRSYKKDLDANADSLRRMRAELKDGGLYLSECRLLDIFLWAYSGTYIPPFRKANLVV